MKRKFTFLILLSFTFCLLSSQVPQGFNYQAIARDGSGNPIVGATIKVMLSVLTDTTGFFASGTGTYIWEEEQTNVKTNAFGLFSITFGNPSAVKVQGSAASFSTIPWSTNPLFIGTKIANPTNYKIMGSAKLWSVPYSMVSGALSGSLSKLAVTGTTTVMDEPLFEVKNNTGQTVFAVYNEGVRAYVDDGIAKGSSKGGFAIGGFGSAKAPSQEFFRVTHDSTRVYVNQPVKGESKGGFAIGGFSGAKSNNSFYLNMTPENYFIGEGSGERNINGLYNSFFGYYSGYNNTDGINNVFIGNLTGYYNKTGSRNTFLGNKAGYGSAYLTGIGNRNVFIGDSAGYNNSAGYDNVFLGSQVGSNNVDGHSNVFMGYRAGYSNAQGFSNTYIGKESGYNAGVGYDNVYIGYRTGYSGHGQYNVYIGHEAGLNNAGGSLNTFVGKSAGRSNISGDYNVFLGLETGYSNQTGTYNVFLGYGAGSSNIAGNRNVFIGPEAGYLETGSNMLYIANSASTPLIGGDFSAGRVGINRMPTTYTLEVGGTIWANGSSISAGATTWSDVRYKTDIVPLAGALEDVLKIQGVRYNWRKSAFPELNFPEGEQIGVIAQELEKILPELVATGPDGFKSVSYEKLTPVLVEAIKEQQREIEELKLLVNSLLPKK